MSGRVGRQGRQRAGSGGSFGHRLRSTRSWRRLAGRGDSASSASVRVALLSVSALFSRHRHRPRSPLFHLHPAAPCSVLSLGCCVSLPLSPRRHPCQTPLPLLRYADGGQSSTCDPVHPGFNGSSWHAGNGTVLANLSLSVRYDSSLGTADLPMAGTLEGSSISWADGSSWVTTRTSHRMMNSHAPRRLEHDLQRGLQGCDHHTNSPQHRAISTKTWLQAHEKSMSVGVDVAVCAAAARL